MARSIVYILILSVILAGCGSPERDQASSLRLISAAPSVTEILFALDLEEEVVGVTTHCNYPSEAQDKTKIGTFSYPNMERIMELKPDIVFTTGLEQAPLREKLNKLDITTVTIYPKTVEELYESIIHIGELTLRLREAQIIVKEMKKKVKRIEEKVSRIPADSRKKVLIEMMDDPLIVASSNSFVGELGAIAGGENIAYDTDRAYSKFSPELVVKRNPDCIILGYMFKNNDAIKRVQKRLGWSSINAVKTGSVFNDINPDILLRPGPRVQEAIEEIYNRLYGD